MIKKINRQELQELTGLSKTQINRIFKQARLSLASEFPFYQNRKILSLPVSAIEKIVGYELTD
ncbi:DUF3173 domain-containing protein [Lactococcus garvieae subsp. garvieae]|uniref:DUF3173 family protein n=1 Tax=Lactococcus garvieae TaxID=1363 RepID=UPI0005AB273A|nr:DUF3173 family protein [Lactococcus garvieae]KAA8710688.1 DUF3173 domain-containing protein [Lactococcus garvieae subsp. garvieae]MDG6192275.1 DUF3173 domain-containing protein [Lactococcus garvieae]PCR99385.1 hypothetical protein RU85_GL001136 [Lactococcus garvieae]QPR49394.1 DUF3173 family protein [Lactococcus garvieae]